MIIIHSYLLENVHLTVYRCWRFRLTAPLSVTVSKPPCCSATSLTSAMCCSAVVAAGDGLVWWRPGDDWLPSRLRFHHHYLHLILRYRVKRPRRLLRPLLPTSVDVGPQDLADCVGHRNSRDDGVQRSTPRTCSYSECGYEGAAPTRPRQPRRATLPPRHRDGGGPKTHTPAGWWTGDFVVIWREFCRFCRHN